jgi:hypothetical protein
MLSTCNELGQLHEALVTPHQEERCRASVNLISRESSGIISQLDHTRNQLSHVCEIESTPVLQALLTDYKIQLGLKADDEKMYGHSATTNLKV